MNSLVYVTSNPKKVELASRFLSVPIEHRAIELPEIQSLSFEEVVEQKVKEAYRLTGRPVMVQDSGVCYYALGRLPGPLTKWFVEALGSKAALNQLLDNFDDRSATAVSCIGYYDGNELKIIYREAQGYIAQRPTQEKNAWGGWSDAFIYEGTDRPWAELTIQEQNSVSLTGQALRELELYLQEQGGPDV